jgi:phosphatidylserine/phosphatidylglycerophosphate/cardiolipin synthase-like enzyme
MDTAAFDRMLDETLEDRRMSRSERRALREVLTDLAPDAHDRRALRAKVFDAARRAIDGALPGTRETIDWLEEAVKLLDPPHAPGGGELAEALFSPGEACVRRITGLLGAATTSVDICVFTITDDRIARAIAGAHGRGVRVRVISDDDKSQDRGSDVIDLAQQGVPVALDRSAYHMHHKFAVFDERILLTGSYNWTRGAANLNEENIVVLDEPRLVAAFREAFEALWSNLA